MANAILTTKLYVPQPRSDLVPRPRLIRKLKGALRCKLTLISAPAGFGKTTLVSDWITCMYADGEAARQLQDHMSGNRYRVAWLSLDEAENDLHSFLIYVVAAIQTVEPAFGLEPLAALRSSGTVNIGAVLTTLLNEIAELPEDVVLILDDYHVIESQAVDAAVTYVLDHLPAQLHLVIATRIDPTLPVSRLRARGHLIEIRADDLRFTTDEAGAFFNRMMGFDLSAQDIAALGARTEGWITGLQLAALSMQGSGDVQEFVRSFAGSNRYILDYLGEEVFAYQPPDTQDFLLKTSILHRLTGSLCDAVTGRSDGEQTLADLEQGNLFIVSLDNERRWYRYHHLFADLLKRRLRQEHPDWIPPLHRRASAWCEQNSFINQTIEHALWAEDFERATLLIEANADHLWQQGEHANLRRWLGKLPAELMVARPDLCIFHAWYLFAGGQQETAETILQAAENVANQVQTRTNEAERPHPNPVPNSLRFKGRIAAVRAFIASFRGDVPAIIQQAQQALAHLPEQDLTWRSSVAIALGDAHALHGNLTAAYQAYSAAAQACQAAGDIYFVMIANLKLAITLRAQGRLQPAIEICRQQMQLANVEGISQSSAAGWCLAVWGEVLAELNDLDGALLQVQKGIELVERGIDLAMIGWSYVCLVRVLFSRQEFADIEAVIRKTAQLTRAADAPSWITAHMAIWQARLWLKQGKYELAAQWAVERGLGANGENKSFSTTDFYLLFEYTTLARILLMQGRLDKATELLQQLFELAQAGEQATRMIEVLILQALALQAEGQRESAVATLERALILAEPGGYIRTFVDEGPSMAQLLYQARSKGIASDYVRQLLAAFPVSEPEQTTPPHPGHSDLAGIEPLSKRELEILRLIAHGLSNREIGERLFIALDTVKGHNHRIFGKLGVRRRTEAVDQARELGLL